MRVEGTEKLARRGGTERRLLDARRGSPAQIIDRALPYVSKPVGIVLKVDFDGQPVDALYDFAGDRVSSVSCAAQAGSKLYLGNLNGNYVSVLDL